MCEAKPGDRCPAETRDNVEVTLVVYREGYPGGPEVNALASSLAKGGYHEADASTHITVVDPDDPFGVPLYEGEAAHAAQVLQDGNYRAVGTDGQEVYTLRIGNAPTYTQVTGPDPDAEPVPAVRFDDTTQGAGETTYWLTIDNLRRLQATSGFASKDHFDQDFSSAYLDLSGHTPVQHMREDAQTCISTDLETREYQGQTYYCMDGWALDEVPAGQYNTSADAHIHQVLMRSKSLSYIEIQRLTDAYYDNLGPEVSEAYAALPPAPASLDREAEAAVAHSEAATRTVAMAARALAARDRIGQEPGWGQEQYDRLTAPWRKAVGPCHPDDPPLPADMW